MVQIIWGCMYYALKTIAECRKVFDYKAYSGFLVVYVCDSEQWLLVFVTALSRVIVSEHVVFNCRLR